MFIVKIAMFLIICGLIWELINRVINGGKHHAEQWSKEEREILEKQGEPPWEINRIYTKEYLRNRARKNAVECIESNITLEFYRNLEHREDYIQSIVEHRGKKVYIRFYDWRQEPLRCLANYIYWRKNENTR